MLISLKRTWDYEQVQPYKRSHPTPKLFLDCCTLLHKGPDIAPIPGTKRRSYLEENVTAADVALSADEMGALDAALAPDRVSGPRYNERQAAMVDR